MLDQRRRGRAHGGAQGKALHGAPDEQPRGALREREQREADRGDAQAAGDHAPAPEPIRQLAEDEERRDQRDRVDREDQRQLGAREAEALAVDGVERRRQIAVEQEHEQRTGDDDEWRARARARSGGHHHRATGVERGTNTWGSTGTLGEA
jgi:hypothetical protein